MLRWQIRTVDERQFTSFVLLHEKLSKHHVQLYLVKQFLHLLKKNTWTRLEFLSNALHVLSPEKQCSPNNRHYYFASRTKQFVTTIKTRSIHLMYKRILSNENDSIPTGLLAVHLNMFLLTYMDTTLVLCWFMYGLYMVFNMVVWGLQTW